MQWLLEVTVVLLQNKRQKGNNEVFVSAAVQQFTAMVGGKQHPVLNRLNELASCLLTRRSARLAAHQA